MEAQSNFKTDSIPGDGAVDVRGFWVKSQKRMMEILSESLEELGAMKVSIMVQVLLEKDDNYATAMLRSKVIGCAAINVVLLADMFQNFRKMSMDYYGLDPANAYAAPGLS